MRVLVCGGRDYSDVVNVNSSLDSLNLPNTAVVVVGGARGADELAEMWARKKGYEVDVFKPDWSIGKAAGVIRNQDMLDSGVDLVVAFPGGRGTAHMVRIAKAKGVEVIEVS